MRCSRVMSKNKESKNGRGRKQRPKPQRAAKKGAVVGPRRSILSDVRVAAWDRLLRDPCTAPFARPCYGGADAGLFFRTTDIFTPTVTGTGFPIGQVGLNLVIQYTPYNISTGTGLVVTGAVNPGALPNFVANGFSNFITTSGSVRKYRPVASCLKWIPNGAYAQRQGTVGMAYSTGTLFTAGTAPPDVYTSLGDMQLRSTNGSMEHEVRWLPTDADANFTDTSASSNAGAGTVLCVLQAVDGTASTTTTATPNGRFEATTVWEWTPASALSAPPNPQAPVPYTSQQVLSTIEDMGAFLFRGIRTAGRVAGMISDGHMAVQRLLTGGVSSIATRGAPMLTF